MSSYKNNTTCLFVCGSENVTVVLYDFIGTEFAVGEVLFSRVQSCSLQVCIHHT
jgi:hypothetical protein